MTFKEAWEQFGIDYRNECRSLGIKERKFDKTEIISLLSKSYAHLGNTYELVEAAEYVLNLVSGQQEYTTGTAATQIPANILRVHTVRINDSAKTKIDKTEAEGIWEKTIGSGLPTMYAVKGTNTGRKLVINSVPDNSYSGNTE